MYASYESNESNESNDIQTSWDNLVFRFERCGDSLSRMRWGEMCETQVEQHFLHIPIIHGYSSDSDCSI